jgi:hypothetical protein
MEMTTMDGAISGPGLDRFDRVRTGERAAEGLFKQLQRADPVLVGSGLLLLVVFLAASAGMALDPRTILGAPAWLKPAKFAISTAIYCLTLAFVFTHLPDWPRTRRIVGRMTAVVMWIEVAIVGLQAWRGTTSHFNVATTLDATLFAIMGVAIFSQTASTFAVAAALFRQQFDDPAMGWALRAGITLTILGALVGGLMTAKPTPAQLEEARTSGRLTTAGAHTVGLPDGGPGLPGVGWSTRAGDLRVPHFFGLHAIQALPLFALLIRRRPRRARASLVMAAAVAYALVFAFLLDQALRGVPLVAFQQAVPAAEGGLR